MILKAVLFAALFGFFALGASALFSLARRKNRREVYFGGSLADALFLLFCVACAFLLGAVLGGKAGRIFAGENADFGAFITSVFINAFCAAAVFFAASKMKNPPDFFRKKGAWAASLETIKGAGWIVLLMPVLSAIFLLWSGILIACGVEAPKQDVVRMFTNLENPAEIGVAVLAITVFAPVAEELVFRGGLYLILKKYAGAGVAALATSLVFALVHANLYAFAAIFFLSLALILMFEKFGDLRVCMGAHAAFNALNAVSIICGWSEV